MKNMILTVIAFLLLLSTVRGEELADRHKNLCETSEAKSLMANADACQVIISLETADVSNHVCLANTADGLSCGIQISLNGKSSSVKFVCSVKGTALPDLESDFKVDSLVYRATAIVTDKNGKTHLLSDFKKYKLLGNPVIDINLVESLDGTSKPLAEITFAGMDLEDVDCN